MYPAGSTASIAGQHFIRHPLSFTLPAILAWPTTAEPPTASAPLRLLRPPPASSAVFCDLYERGYTVTSASQYGADFLLYDAEPSDVHAHSVLSVRAGGEGEQPLGGAASIHAMELLTLARVCSGVRKSLVTAWQAEGKTAEVSGEEGEAEGKGEAAEVSYLTWTWEPTLSRSR